MGEGNSELNLAAQAVQRILDMIAESGLQPGQPFATEAELERKLGVSRRNVGLVVSKPDPVELFESAFGHYLFDSTDMVELGEFRYALGVGLIELVVQRATPEQRDTLRRRADEHDRPQSSRELTLCRVPSSGGSDEMGAPHDG